MSLFVAGAAFGEVHASLFVAGAVFGEVQVLLFVAGAVFGEVEVSLFVAGAVFGEIWNDSRSAKCCNFQWNLLLASAKVTSAARRVQFCVFMVGSCSERSRIILGSFSDRSRIGNDVSSVFTKFFSDFGRSFFVAGAVFGEVGGCCLSLRAL